MFIAAPLLAATLSLPPNVEAVETYANITQYRLKSNGMSILLVPNHTSPVFTFMVVYHVGSRNEAPGNTGSAHLLEHMIFNKSTENFGRAKGHKTFQEVLYEAGADFASCRERQDRRGFLDAIADRDPAGFNRRRRIAEVRRGLDRLVRELRGSRLRRRRDAVVVPHALQDVLLARDAGRSDASGEQRFVRNARRRATAIPVLRSHAGLQ